MGRELGDQALLFFSECVFFLDDAALVCSCRENMVLAARIFNEVAKDLVSR